MPGSRPADLVRIRREGIAFDDQEAAPSLNCVAVPVFGAGGRPIAALSVSGSVGVLDPRAQAAPLRRVAAAASVALKRSGVGSTVRRARAIA